MKTPSRIIIATLVAAIAFPFAAQAAKGDRKKKDDSTAVTFETADKSKDGTVSSEEFVAAMKDKLGEDGAKARFETLDKDGDHKLTKEEFAAGATETKKKRKKNAN